MSEELFVIAENLLSERKKLARLYRRFPLHLEEISRLLIKPTDSEALDEEIALSYRQIKEEISPFLAKKSEKEKALTQELLDAQEPILAAKLSHLLATNAKITSYLPTLEESSSRIAYFRNTYSDLAFRRFSKELQDPTVLYRESFAAVCEEVYADRCDFAILPVESSRDGILSVTQKLVTRYELAPVFYCTIPTTDDGTLRFGLFASAPVVPPRAELIEIILFSSTEATLPRLLTSANSLGISTQSITHLTPSQGFLHEWKLVFSTKDSKAFDAFWVLLLCEYPHHLLCGICRALA